MKSSPLLLAIIAFLALAGSLFAAFDMQSLEVTIDAKPDGTAHVLEKLDLYLSSAESVDLYETGLSINDLGTWKERIGLTQVRYHLDPALVSISNIRIRPQPISRCISVGDVRSQCFTTLIFDYDVSPLERNGTKVKGTGLFSLENFKPRTTRYVLNRNALSFEANKNGDIVIPRNVKLTIDIPRDSTNIYIQPLPADMEGSVQPPFKNIYTFRFENTLLSRFELSFQREETLDKEVFSTFQAFQETIGSLLNGPQGIAVGAIAIVIIVSFLYLSRMKKRKQE